MLKDTGILAQLVERFIYTEDAGSSNLSCPMGVLVNLPFIVPSDGVGWGPWWCGVQGVTKGLKGILKGFQRNSKGIQRVVLGNEHVKQQPTNKSVDSSIDSFIDEWVDIAGELL